MLSTRALSIAALLSLGRLAVGQTLVVDDEVLQANASTVAPAAEAVDPSASAVEADLFSAEAVQLTDTVMANLTSLNLSDVSFFAFQNDSGAEALRKRTLFGPCKTYPGDLLWPINLVWNLFDLLLGGALVKTVPFASVCYNDFGNYNAAKCNFITNNWVNNSYIHIEDPTSINAVLFEGLNCMPPSIQPGATQCKLGGYPAYAVEATNVAQIQLAVNLARNLNLRLVIKNTGHDFGAKSVGMGALSIWTHKLKSIQFLQNYKQGSYNGPAFKLGAGVQAYELYEAARQRGVTAVGGEGRTVGVMGGYILGGGHSPLSGLYGMAADQVLSMQVVTADGRFVTASADTNSDLFWALCGGGGSSYGVVTSVVVKVYPKIKVATMSFVLTTSPTVSSALFWKAVRAYFDGFIKYAVDNGNYEYFRIFSIGPDAYMFDMLPWFAPGMTVAQLQALVAPLMAQWAAMGVQVSPVYKQYDDFYDAWWENFPLEPWGSNAIRQASRLFPKQNWQDQAKLNATFDAIKSTVEEGAYIIAFNIAAAPKTGYPDNAVNPAWRETVMHCIGAVFWDPSAPESERKAASDKLTYDWMARWRNVSPGAGAYMSESDYIEPNFTQAFWGTKYAKALQLKKKWDPYDVFYAQNAVGSEAWKMSANIMGNLPSQNSKLCRK